MDEKRLEEIENGGRVTNGEMDEVFRLARLGLEVENWRREHGVVGNEPPQARRYGVSPLAKLGILPGSLVPDNGPTPRQMALAEWAEKHGRKTVEKYATMEDWGYDRESDSDCDYGEAARDALAALPKPEPPLTEGMGAFGWMCAAWVMLCVVGVLLLCGVIYG